MAHGPNVGRRCHLEPNSPRLVVVIVRCCSSCSCRLWEDRVVVSLVVCPECLVLRKEMQRHFNGWWFPPTLLLSSSSSSSSARPCLVLVLSFDTTDQSGLAADVPSCLLLLLLLECRWEHLLLLFRHGRLPRMKIQHMDPGRVVGNSPAADGVQTSCCCRWIPFQNK